MALFVPPLLGAAVVFEPSSNPAEIMRTIKQERATRPYRRSAHARSSSRRIEREFEGRGKLQWLNSTLENAKGRKFLKRAWMFAESTAALAGSSGRYFWWRSLVA